MLGLIAGQYDWQVLSYHSADEGINQQYLLSLRARVLATVDAQTLLGEHACVQVHCQYRHGFIQQLIQEPPWQDGWHYWQLQIAAPLRQLARKKINKTHPATNLQAWLIAQGIDAQHLRLETNPSLDTFVTFDQDMLSCFEQLLIQHNLLCYYQQRAHHWVCVIGEQLPVMPVKAMPLFNLERYERTSVSGITLESDEDSVTIAVDSRAHKHFTWYQYQPYPDKTALKQHAAQMRRQCLWQQVVIQAETDCLDCSEGMLVRHLVTNEAYRIIHMRVVINREKSLAFGEPACVNQVTLFLIPARVAFAMPIPELAFWPFCKTPPLPSTTHYFLAKQQGDALCIQFDFDEEKQPAGITACAKVQVANKLHWQSQTGSPVLVACLAGRINAPVIVGHVVTPKAPSPVTKRNQAQQVLASTQGVRWIADDSESSPGIYLHARDDSATLEMREHDNMHHFALNANAGDLDFKSNAHSWLVCGGHYQVRASTVKFSGDWGVNIQTESDAKIAAAKLSLEAGQNLIVAAKASITLNVAKQMVMQARGSVQWTASMGDINIKSEGAITIDSRVSQLQALEIRLTTKGSALTLSERGVQCRADKIQLSAKHIQLLGPVSWG